MTKFLVATTILLGMGGWVALATQSWWAGSRKDSPVDTARQAAASYEAADATASSQWQAFDAAQKDADAKRATMASTAREADIDRARRAGAADYAAGFSDAARSETRRGPARAVLPVPPDLTAVEQ